MAIQPTSPPATQFVSKPQPLAQITQGSKAGTSPQVDKSQSVANTASAQRPVEDGKTTAINSNNEALREALERAQTAITPKSVDITFTMNDKADAVVVKIIDRDSEEVIRQIPSDEFLKIAEKLNEQIQNYRAGMLVEQKA
ncbi:flagellar protein FlaG [Nitrogeniibacter mangrovi]|uniref:Flagellar protein FlaG n=1 Tax=Nitrogeniibacter mangrovi TaxID=2016596 RepID=A0A6C1B1T7_9RHOO|nr:flagellar protein FlaG [Nitrogeniibacter mangrovi]QID17323.1 flagellar protein FlaG [Nitrogeniibacter mangrovi]